MFFLQGSMAPWRPSTLTSFAHDQLQTRSLGRTLLANGSK